MILARLGLAQVFHERVEMYDKVLRASSAEPVPHAQVAVMKTKRAERGAS